MALFAVMVAKDHPNLVAKLQTSFPENHLKVANGQWIVSSLGTAKEVSDILGISEGEAGTTGIVCTIGNYFGRASSDIWEWMASRLKRGT